MLFVLVCYFIFQSIAKNLDQIRTFRFNPDWRWLLPALLVWFISQLYPVAAWRQLISMLGGHLHPGAAFRIWFTSNIGRYLPGGIWVYAGLVVLAEKEGVGKRVSFQAMIYSQAVSNLLGIAFILLVLNNLFPVWLLILIMAGGLLFLWPRVFTGCLNLALKILKKAPLEKQLTFRELFYYFFLQGINWLLMSLTFYLFLNAFVPVSIIEHPNIILLMPACWTAAFLTPVTPGGIGVREALLATLLTPVTGPAPAIVLPWLHRLIQTVIEVILTAGFWLSGRGK